jgi:xylose isomerase
LDVGHELQAGENVAESVSLLSHTGKLFHLHINDNYRGWDDDMAFESVHMVEFLEMMYTLRTVGYDSWFSVDIYPNREDPAKVVAESIEYLKGLDSLVDRIGMDSFAEALAGDDPVQLLSKVREATLG